MISPELKSSLPSTEDLPCSDDTPVDNEDQNLLPNLLLFVLNSIWSQRLDWYFGVDMAVYHTTGISPKVPVVPDGFLSLGVERQKGGKSRRSYAVWEEREIVPILALEMVSHQPGGEYDEKMAIYDGLGVLYYIIYNPEFWRRDRHQPFEVYQLSDGEYRQQIGEPYWMPEVGLGMGRSLQTIGGIEREILAWYDEGGNVYPLPEVAMRQMREQLRIEREHAETERQRAERLAQYLRSQVIDPDNLPEF
ncbi:MAG: Uma2 family endonuclease [Cyanobacteria bacterium J055]|nr:MAG: Uma2 family endonuclease [Cyanobacteria bacterium J055]